MYPSIKYGLDFLFALMFLFMLLPVILLVALTLTFQNAGSPWFMQTRQEKMETCLLFTNSKPCETYAIITDNSNPIMIT